MPHILPIVTVLILVPLYVWIIRRRLGTSRRNADLWFKPTGGDFIYQPRGGWGKAYVVSAITRDRIKQGNALTTKIVLLMIAAIYLSPMALLVYDPALYRRILPQIVLFRVVGIGLAAVAALVMHHIAVRPLYARAPLSTVRISTSEVRERLAARASWNQLVVRIMLSAGLLVATLYGAINRPPNVPTTLYMVGALLFSLALLNSVRLALVKAGRY